MREEAVKIYRFDELSEEAKEKAISNHIHFEIEVADKDSLIWPAIEEAERLQTPWFMASIVYEKYKAEMEETIRINEYEFIADGRLWPV